MPCLVALLVLSVLGIFSASHRKMAREAFDCVFLRIRLKPCDTGFDVKFKSKLLSKLINRSPKSAKFVNKHFELLSWVFMLLMLISSLYFLRGVYYYYAWGNCSGPTSSNFCVFDPTGKNSQSSSISTECSLDPKTSADLSLAPIDLESYTTIEADNSYKKLTFIGCFSCPYTRETYPIIRDLIDNHKPSYTFVHFPVHQDTEYLASYNYCINRDEPEKYYQFVDAMFENPVEEISNSTSLLTILESAAIDMSQLKTCLEDEMVDEKVQARLDAVAETGIFGTPTIFIGDEVIVGPKPARVYRRLLRNSWLGIF